MPPRIDCDVEILRHLYFDCGLSTAQAGVRAGLGPGRSYLVGRRLKEAGYSLRKAGWRATEWPIERMRKMYVEDGMASEEVAAAVGCSPSQARRVLKKAGALRRRGASTKNRRGENAPCWKGGRFVSKHGYVFVRKPEHPMAAANGYVAEHRLVAAESLNTILGPKDEVHHINGVHGDNRPENLMVIPSGAHQKLHADVRRELWSLKHEVARLRGELKGGTAWRVVG